MSDSEPWAPSATIRKYREGGIQQPIYGEFKLLNCIPIEPSRRVVLTDDEAGIA